jgi:hypothetical protein
VLVSGSNIIGQDFVGTSTSSGCNLPSAPRPLSAGTYTLEATTYGAGQTGSFSISVISSTASYAISGNVTTSTGGALSQVQVTAGSGSATTDGNGAYSITGLGNGSYSVVPTRSGFTFSPASRSVNINGSSVSSQNFTVVTSSTGGCSVQAITPNTSVSGNWGTDCASVHRSGKYARFYTFTLSASASVQIDATSDEDTRTLSAGTYTIEVTTYFSARTGPFVIRVTR